MPPDVMLPPVADQVTPVLVVPVTAALNCCVCPTDTEADDGERLTLTTGVVAAWVPDKVQPASDRIASESSEIIAIIERDSQRARCLWDVIRRP
jgi:hypothetical protein